MGKDKNYSSSVYRTSADLHVSIFSSNIGDVQECTKNKEIINSYWRGCTPISSAINLKRYEILKLLVQSGANCNLRTRNNRMEPPLFSACRQQDREAINILLTSRNIDVDQENFYGHSALWAAARYCPVDVVEHLLHHGAKLNKIIDNSCLRHPITGALQQHGRHAKKVIHLLVSQGSLLDTVCKESPLKWAVRHADRQTFCLLVEAGCTVKREDWLSYDKLPVKWKQDTLFCNWIESLMDTPKSLKLLTICLIRNNLASKFNNLDEANHLGLPPTVTSRITFSDYDPRGTFPGFSWVLKSDNLPERYRDWDAH